MKHEKEKTENKSLVLIVNTLIKLCEEVIFMNKDLRVTENFEWIIKDIGILKFLLAFYLDAFQIFVRFCLQNVFTESSLIFQVLAKFQVEQNSIYDIFKI